MKYQDVSIYYTVNVITRILAVMFFIESCWVYSQIPEESKVTIEYVNIDIADISDSLITISEKEIEDYYDNHKFKIYSPAKAKLNYVIFSFLPGKNDTDAVLNSLKSIREIIEIDINNENSVIAGVKSFSDTDFDPEKFYSAGDLNTEVTDFLLNCKPFTLSEIIYSNDGIRFISGLQIKESDIECVKASHILIEFRDDTIAAKLKAESILTKIRSGDNFSDIAAEYSDDIATKFNNGNVGWFFKGTMVAEFEESVFNGKINDIIGPLKTIYGWHIIRVENKTRKVFRFADFKKKVLPSEREIILTEKKANEFYKLSEINGFLKTADNLGLKIILSDNFTQDSFVPFFGLNNHVMEFSFNNPIGSVSKPIKISGGFAVLQIAAMYPGISPDIENIRSMIISNLKEIKKYFTAETIINNIYSKILNNDLSSISDEKTINLQKIEQADKEMIGQLLGNEAVNIVFKMQINEITKPFKTENGWYIIQLKDILNNKYY